MIYIVVLNYKNWKDSIACLDSLLRLDYPDYHIIFVDNASPDDSMEKIEAWAQGNFDLETDPTNPLGMMEPLLKPIAYQKLNAQKGNPDSFAPPLSRLTLIQSDENKGYAAGNNIALRYILKQENFSYTWILNNDTVIPTDALRTFMEDIQSWHRRGRQYALFNSKLFYYDQPQRLQSVACYYNKALGRVKLIGQLEKDEGQFDHYELNPHYPNGASMMVSRDFVEKVGLMSEEYFLYYEEVDWTRRGLAKGFEMGYSFHSKVYHKEGATIGGNLQEKSLLSEVCALANRLIITRKFFPFYLPFIYLGSLLVIVNRVRRKQFKRIPLIIKIIINPRRSRDRFLANLK